MYFHVSLLKPWNSDKHGVIPIPPTLTLGGQQEFEVQRILDHKEKHVGRAGRGRPKCTREYLVSCRGPDYTSNTWEPREQSAERAQESSRNTGQPDCRPEDCTSLPHL